MEDVATFVSLFLPWLVLFDGSVLFLECKVVVISKNKMLMQGIVKGVAVRHDSFRCVTATYDCLYIYLYIHIYIYIYI